MAEMMKGNVAIAEAAVRAGVRFYAGYPITPSSEIMEYLSWRLSEVGGSFVQAESELAGINMVFGASSCGVRAMTASSGPGISLKQEGISALSDEELPALVINMVRYGNGLGTLFSSQCDYHRETHGGGHGDYRCIVLSPSSIQEAVDLIPTAYELGEKYRVVVVLMSEGALGQMMEPVELPEFLEPKKNYWGFDGKHSYKKIGIFDRDSMKEAVELNKKYAEIKENEQRWESEGLEDADYVFVAYGLPGRSTLGAVRSLREQGYKVGLIRPITTWPFPENAFREVNPKVKAMITVEANATGQLVDDVALYTKKIIKSDVPVYALPFVYGVPPMKEIQNKFRQILAGEIKEVY
ncbi:3-methyl-2-oxobutanoate dehydrogenase subunit beta [Lactonifactor sp. BIOML-A3]|uniref:3-methyl-2-oxobutanoate dehydrogenase subunit beta n=1 Tax=unclassified Lactonifactor TaxID=2636670 RepID=UPI0012AF4FCD|nr:MULTISPECIES: 3-methyl-2-oxobutanoate dehydrogenase subunit beta [unclassified Lactonifactor]MSA03315.1 3-methyl-2-oxobutanoate dehydrogenase subunit beta [Lactonifactor sp. BIOML-A5]MSA09664.1 3-methyl-2-oxobutanoate dehydrogenase subunit beta [Lactonifactor sp. BIOML-A4]MSA14206.1 3-methyl-2-oxobutanoate dehydrogenase subunit beta [Lactonifactor sp. BIOML-A3]MSA18669.1 3-methyl-2-oxobutanoate dehydrogenase subunit beta [Lactonifactor sp. BIOML-A2]MSA39451.1 3-methyl-2-oxobutanoate dehydro